MDEIEPKDTAEKPRALARRRQVLEAAAICFRRHGFHSTSMAQISAEAGMSVGHIYRYFTGKEAIIKAIVREGVDDVLSRFDAFPRDPSDLRAALSERAYDGVMHASDPEVAALMIEIRAEAARNPAIRDVVRESDQQISQKLGELLGPLLGPNITPADLDARIEMFQLIFQGVAWRTVVNPHIDRSALAAMIALTIKAILP